MILSDPSSSHLNRALSQVLSVSSGQFLSYILLSAQSGQPTLPPSSSSAKDQLTGSSVAIKKIMKPFSTPVLSKRTYRELKLLKHIQHENVRPLFLTRPIHLLSLPQIISLSDVFISPLEDMYV